MSLGHLPPLPSGDSSGATRAQAQDTPPLPAQLLRDPSQARQCFLNRLFISEQLDFQKCCRGSPGTLRATPVLPFRALTLVRTRPPPLPVAGDRPPDLTRMVPVFLAAPGSTPGSHGALAARARLPSLRPALSVRGTGQVSCRKSSVSAACRFPRGGTQRREAPRSARALGRPQHPRVTRSARGASASGPHEQRPILLSSLRPQSLGFGGRGRRAPAPAPRGASAYATCNLPGRPGSCQCRRGRVRPGPASPLGFPSFGTRALSRARDPSVLRASFSAGATGCCRLILHFLRPALQ